MAVLYLGRRYASRGNMSQIFNAGAPGYVLNRAALKRLVVDGLPYHHVHTISFGQDMMVGNILRALDISAYPTRDTTDAERFMPFPPGLHYRYRWPRRVVVDWYALYAVEKMRFGLDHCSKYSVAFSYNRPHSSIRRFYALKYGLCPPPRRSLNAPSDTVISKMHEDPAEEI